MNVSAYNSHGPEAKHILAITDPDDVLSQQMICTARVQVNDAFFYDDYQGPGRLRRPAMKLTGTVSSLFIEDDDDRQFPCGSKEIELMSPQDVGINYVLSTSELQSLVGMGLFNDDFQPPENLIGNTLEVPLNVVYKGIYESPCCFIEIVDPGRINTCTKDNHYDGIFMGCRTHPGVIAEQSADYEYTKMNVLPDKAFEPAPMPVPTEEPVADEVQTEETPVVMSDEEREEADILGRTAAKIDEAVVAHTEQQSNGAREFNAGPLVDEVQREAKADAEAAAAAARADAPFNDESDSGVIDGPHIVTISDKIAKLKEKARDYVGSNSDTDSDSSLDAQGENEPDDNAFFDYGSSDFEEDADDTKANVKRRAEAAARKQREIARRLDVAEDNKALNEGNTDIAGHGASEKSETPNNRAGGLAQRLLAGIKPSNNTGHTDDSQQFL